MKLLNTVASILVVVGAINWGLWGFLQFDLVAYLFGGISAPISRIVYGLVGLAGLWKVKCMVSQSTCSTGKKGGGCC